MKNNYPKISIVTVSYNQGQFIEDNIVSVINQDYPNVEHIIIDAGSTDGTLDILKNYDSYEHINWISEPDEGQSDGLNKGFRKANGDIIGWFNSDDRVPPGALREVANFFMEHPNEIAVVGDQRIIDDQGDEKKVIKSREYTFDYLLNHAKGITQNSTFFKRSVFQEIGYLDEDIEYAMDRDLFIRIARQKKMPYIQEILGEFRIQENSKTSDGTYNFAKELIKIRYKYDEGHILSPGMVNDLYIIMTQPFRKISWLRNTIRKIKSI
jgi:glycosyltransferase involved in cell wall biosynthesis